MENRAQQLSVLLICPHVRGGVLTFTETLPLSRLYQVAPAGQGDDTEQLIWQPAAGRARAGCCLKCLSGETDYCLLLFGVYP